MAAFAEGGVHTAVVASGPILRRRRVVVGRKDLGSNDSGRAPPPPAHRVRAIGKTKQCPRPHAEESTAFLGEHVRPSGLAYWGSISRRYGAGVTGLSVVDDRTAGARDGLPAWATRANAGGRRNGFGIRRPWETLDAGLGSGS